MAKAEKVTSYEVGAKTQFMDRRVTLNMAGFYYDYSNKQLIGRVLDDPAHDPEGRVDGLLKVQVRGVQGDHAVGVIARVTGEHVAKRHLGSAQSMLGASRDSAAPHRIQKGVDPA